MTTAATLPEADELMALLARERAMIVEVDVEGVVEIQPRKNALCQRVLYGGASEQMLRKLADALMSNAQLMMRCVDIYRAIQAEENA